MLRVCCALVNFIFVATKLDIYYIQDAKNHIYIEFYSIRFLLQKIGHISFSRKHETYIIGKLLGLKRQRGEEGQSITICNACGRRRKLICIPYVMKLSFRKRETNEIQYTVRLQKIKPSQYSQMLQICPRDKVKQLKRGERFRDKNKSRKAESQSKQDGLSVSLSIFI